MIRKALFWGSLGALAWTHVGYPAAAAALARIRPRPVRRDDVTPEVSVIVAAHDEEDVIGRRVENLLELDYPADRLRVVVASDGSTDRTNEIVRELADRSESVELLECERAGKATAQNAAVAQSDAEVVAFSDANSRWEPDALRKLVRSFADPDVGYVCGQLRLESSDGVSQEGLYWRYELWQRESESAIGSITAGNGAIYAVRRSDYLGFDDPRIGHDFGLPFRLVQRGRRAVYDSEAVAWEKPAIDAEEEYGRKVRMMTRSWRPAAGRLARADERPAVRRGARLAPRAPVRKRRAAPRAPCVDRRPRAEGPHLSPRAPGSARLPRARARRAEAAAGARRRESPTTTS